MGKVSTLIGEVIDGSPKFNRQVKDEKFFTIEVNFNGTQIPVIYSEYSVEHEFDNNSKVRVTGSLMSDKSKTKSKLPVFYFFANSIESVDIDEDTTNLINFSCKVTKVREKQVNTRGVDLLPLVASDGSPLDTTSILYLCARGRDARKLKDSLKDSTITGTGYLKQFRDVYEIYIMSVEVAE